MVLGLFWACRCGAEDGLASVLRKAKIWERINSQSPVNERQRKAINRLLDGFEGKLSTSKYAKLAKCSGDTALRDIRILLDRGILTQDEGGGRNTSYRLVEPEVRLCHPGWIKSGILQTPPWQSTRCGLGQTALRQKRKRNQAGLRRPA